MKRVSTLLQLCLMTGCLLFPGRSISAENSFDRGFSSLSTGQYEIAIMAFTKSIEADPQSAEAHCNRGVARFFMRDYDRAISDFDRALEIKENYVEAYCNRGVAWANKGKYDRAIADFTRVLNLKPPYAMAYCGRGVSMFFKGEYDRAIADFTKALEINPEYADAYCNRGVAWVRKGGYDRAIADFTRALEIDPAYAVAYSSRGRARFSKEAYEGAITDYTRALEINPNYMEARNQLAWALAVSPDDKYRNGAMALDMALKSVELKPEPGFLATLAAAYAEEKQFGNAIQTQKKAIALLKKADATEGLSEYEKRLRSFEAEKPLRLSDMFREEKAGEYKLRLPGPKVEMGMPIVLSKRPVTQAKHVNYPYTIQVGSYKDADLCIRLVHDLRKKGHPAISSRTHIPGKGAWSRIFVGFYEDTKKAQKAVGIWKGVFPKAYVIKKPYAVQVGRSVSDHERTKLAAELQSKGYITYFIPDSREKGKTKILIGAFSSKKEASGLIQGLKKEGFKPEMVLR